VVNAGKARVGKAAQRATNADRRLGVANDGAELSRRRSRVRAVAPVQELPDVDVVDFTDAPLSEHPSRNTGLKLDEMLSALKILTSGAGLVAITLTELNPHNAAADDGLLERFAASFADAMSSGLQS
jgi:arginase family enzyme